MGMKYIIYGAGRRGRNILELVGAENVLAFADSDEKKAGSSYCSLPVVGMKELEHMCKDALCIVTPLRGWEEIACGLQKLGIRKYLPIKPADQMLAYGRDNIFARILKQISGHHIGIYGISAGTVLLYEFLAGNSSIEPVLIPAAGETGEAYEFLASHYRVVKWNEAVSQMSDLLIADLYIENELAEEAKKNTHVWMLKDIFEESLALTDERVREYKDRHKGERCFIVATGPSLLTKDLDTLKRRGEICFSMNRIYNIFDKTDWRPDYYMIEDGKMIEDLKDQIAKLDLPVKFVASKPESYWQQENICNSFKFRVINLDFEKQLPLFSEEAEKYIYEGYTVTYACLQMAVYMGFQEIYLLGVDFNYSKNICDESNHFAGYQKDQENIRLNPVYPEKNERAYQKAEKYAKEHGIRIYNATRGGKLEVFERVDFDEEMEKK